MIQDRIDTQFDTDPNLSATPEILHANEILSFDYEHPSDARSALEEKYIEDRTDYMAELGWCEYEPGENDRDKYDTPESGTTCFVVTTPEGEVSAGYRLTPLSIEQLLDEVTKPETDHDEENEPYNWPLSLEMWADQRYTAAAELAQCILELEEIGFQLGSTGEQAQAYDMTRLFTRHSLAAHRSRENAIRSSADMFRAFGRGMAECPGMWIFNTTPRIVDTLERVGILSVVVAEAILSPDDEEPSLLCLIPDIRAAYIDMTHQPGINHGRSIEYAQLIEEGFRSCPGRVT